MIFTGNCPQCELKGHKVEMLRYDIAFISCPVCGLTIIEDDKQAVIVPSRVRTDLETQRQIETAGSLGSPLVFKENEIETKEELAYIIQTKITVFVPFSLHNLIDYYAKSLYADSEQKKKFANEYKRQSGVLKIDFNDKSIIDKLKKRDVKAGNPKEKSFVHTHELMIFLFKKYYNNETSWLPEMGMGPYQLALCKKHLPSGDSKLLENNPYVRKQRLMSFIIDVVEIIYLDKKTRVSKKYL